jgi:hypothetical protein
LKDCVIISHYHHGISYDDAFELTPFEKDVAAEFIEEELEREAKIRSATMGMRSKSL